MSAATLLTFLLFIFVVATMYLVLPRSSSALPVGDAAVIAQLRKAGSDLSKVHPVEFFLYVPTEDSAKRVAQKLVGQGFTPTVQPAASGALDWLVVATRTVVPTLDLMAQVRTELSALSAAEGGEYDGWGTPLVK